MILSETEHSCLRGILQAYEKDPRVLEMDNYIQHGSVTTYQHCWNVARVSFWINRRFHLGADETALAVGALPGGLSWESLAVPAPQAARETAMVRARSIEKSFFMDCSSL